MKTYRTSQAVDFAIVGSGAAGGVLARELSQAGFLCDGSSLVTSGRGQPTLTIQALAFRAAEHIANFARRGEV